MRISLLFLLLFVSECNGFVRFPNRMPILSCRKGLSKTVQSMRKRAPKAVPQAVSPQVAVDHDVPSLERLYPDAQDLIQWVEKYGGEFKADIALEKEGWTLASQTDVPANTVLIRIPKKLCIFADETGLTSPLLEGTTVLMGSLQASQWRARLALAVMSERARPNSFFLPYLRNLPVNFPGIPLFYSEAELLQTQEPGVMHRTTERIRFLSEFATSVLGPLQKTPLDPFSGQETTLDHLVWGFAAATSRALRNIQTTECYASTMDNKRNIVETSAELREDGDVGQGQVEMNVSPPSQNAPFSTTLGPVMVPAIDLAAHSLAPTCAVRDTGDAFVLYTLRAVKAGEGLTIHYGALSNDELLDDYGFTIDNNPYDSVLLDFSQVMLNAARGVVGQSDFTSFVASPPSKDNLRDEAESDGVNWIPADEPAPATATSNHGVNGIAAVALKDANRRALVRKAARSKQQVVREDTLGDWQKVWLTCLGLKSVLGGSERMYLGHIPTSVMETTVEGVKPVPRSTELVKYNPQVDPRLLALLRILYSNQESELLRHGFDPWSVQHSGSLLSSPQEAQVVRTLLGVLSIIARYYDTTLAQDLRLLKDNIVPSVSQDSAIEVDDNNSKQAESEGSVSVGGSPAAETIKAECRGILRSVLRVNQLARTTALPANDKTQDFGKPSTLHKQTENNLMKFSATLGAPDRPLTRTDATAITITAGKLSGQELLSFLPRRVAPRDVVFMQKAAPMMQQNKLGKLSSADDEVVDFTQVHRWGEKLPINIREAYKYRIRRKKLVWDLLVKYAGMYELLAQPSGGSALARSSDHASAITDLTLSLTGATARSNSNSEKALTAVKSSTTTIEAKQALQPRSPPTEEQQALVKLRQLSKQWATYNNL